MSTSFLPAYLRMCLSESYYAFVSMSGCRGGRTRSFLRHTCTSDEDRKIDAWKSLKWLSNSPRCSEENWIHRFLPSNSSPPPFSLIHIHLTEANSYFHLLLYYQSQDRMVKAILPPFPNRFFPHLQSRLLTLSFPYQPSPSHPHFPHPPSLAHPIPSHPIILPITTLSHFPSSSFGYDKSMMPKRRMSFFVWGEGGWGVVQLVLLWGKGVGGLEVRGVCEGGRLKGEERKRPGEMGGAGAGVWGAGWWWGWWIDSELSYILARIRGKGSVTTMSILKTSRPENQEETPVLLFSTLWRFVYI